jgi:hypothetical protein
VGIAEFILHDCTNYFIKHHNAVSQTLESVNNFQELNFLVHDKENKQSCETQRQTDGYNRLKV